MWWYINNIIVLFIKYISKYNNIISKYTVFIFSLTIFYSLKISRYYFIILLSALGLKIYYYYCNVIVMQIRNVKYCTCRGYYNIKVFLLFPYTTNLTSSDTYRITWKWQYNKQFIHNIYQYIPLSHPLITKFVIIILILCMYKFKLITD